MGKRVFLFNQLPEELRTNPRGGKGEMIARAVIAEGQPLAPGSPFVASGINAIQPGGGIGMHLHADDEEAYIIISGKGEYIDNEGVRHKVAAGDITFCCKGERHGMENAGSEPLVFGAVIAKQGVLG